MCGFAGFLTQASLPQGSGAALEAMSGAIRHRGPDDGGAWLDEAAGIALGHRRLAIVDLSPAGHQPMVSASGRFVIVFNGEIYNHAELRRSIEDEGRAPGWRGHSDTETLLEAAAAWGLEAALKRSVGMFALAIWDRESRTLTLARDRLGEKPLYYGLMRGSFLFGSDLAALRQHPAWQGEICREAVTLLLRAGNVPAPYSIYEGIRKLPPGCVLAIASPAAAPRLTRYWDAAEMACAGLAAPFSGSAEEAADETERLIRQSLAGQMVADVPLGAFLSGGIDSSTVVALMQAMSARPVKTFSIGFHEQGYDEAQHAKAVARHLGTDHSELYVSMADAMAVIPRLPQIYSEPFADASQFPTLLVSELARREVTVSLSGDGGDELFSGYTRYALAHDLWPRLSRIPGGLRRAGAGAIRAVPPGAWDGAARVAGPLLPRRLRGGQMGDRLHKAARVMGLQTPGEIYRELTSLWPNPAALVRGGREPVPGAEVEAAAARMPGAMRPMMLKDLTGYLPDDILVKLDRASMAVSLESRVPLIDHRLVEWSWTLPDALLRHEGRSKWPLRAVLERHVPRALVERPKMGFGVPIDSWLRGPLREWAEHLLSESRLEQGGLLEAKPIRAAWARHLSGRANLQYPLWAVLMLEAWREAERTGAPPGRPHNRTGASLKDERAT